MMSKGLIISTSTKQYSPFEIQDTRYLEHLRDHMKLRESYEGSVHKRRELLESNKRKNYQQELDRLTNELHRPNLPPKTISADPWVACWTVGRFNLPLSPSNTLKSGAGGAGTGRGYPEPFGLLEPPAQNPGPPPFILAFSSFFVFLTFFAMPQRSWTPPWTPPASPLDPLDNPGPPCPALTY